MLPNLHISLERWKKNKEYGVWVSNQGRIKLIKNKQLLEQRIDRCGYCIVFTNRGAITVHQLVAATWLGKKDNDSLTIDHISTNKRDNSTKNLRLVSEEINLTYANYIGTNVIPTDPVRTPAKISINAPDKIQIDDSVKMERKAVEKVNISAPEKVEVKFNEDTTKAIARDQILNFLKYNSADKRVNAFKTNLKQGNIRVKYGDIAIYTMEDFTSVRKYLLPTGVTEAKFIDKVVNVSNKPESSYCGLKWKIEVR